VQPKMATAPPTVSLKAKMMLSNPDGYLSLEGWQKKLGREANIAVGTKLDATGQEVPLTNAEAFWTMYRGNVHGVHPSWKWRLPENQSITDIRSSPSSKTKQLYECAEDDTVERALKLISRGANVNAIAGTDGSTPLHICARHNSLAMLEMFEGLIRAGTCCPRLVDGRGRTAADLARELGHTNFATKLEAVMSECNIPISGPHKHTQLCAADSCWDVAARRCSACKAVYYCTPKCQKAHWSMHKRSCQKAAEQPPGDQPSVSSD